MNKELRLLTGAVSLALLLSGCGTSAAARSHLPALVPVTLTQGSFSVRAKVPASWAQSFVQPGAGDGIWIGSSRVSFNWVVGNPYHWEPSHIEERTADGQFTLYKPLGGHNYVAVVVPVQEKPLAIQIGNTAHAVSSKGVYGR